MLHSMLLMGLACCAQVAPSAQPSPALPTEVSRLVKQLDDASQAKRDTAEKQLVELGEDVLPLLPAITPRTPAEVKERLGRVRRTLETAASQSVSQPKLVTLQGEISFADAMRALEKQTGNRVTGFERRSGLGTVKLDFDKVLYWQALDEVLDQSQLNINPYGGEPNALVVMARPEGEMPRAGRGTYSGIFRFEVLRVEARRDLRNPSASGMRLTLSVTWEPRVTPISLRQPIDKISALSGDGSALEIGRSDSQSVLNASGELGMSAIELGIPFQLPDRNVRKISVLMGTLTALVPGRLESFEFTDLETTRDAELQRAGVTVIFEQLRRNGDLFEARLRVRFSDAANALESHRSWIFANPAYMIGADGQRMENLGSNEGSRDENEVGIVCLFDLPKGPRGCKFVYQTPASLLELPVEYELKDIDLP
jgi:hypothetical protein